MNSNRIYLPKINIVLVEPEIPPNTGNIARLCAATRSRLHLVHPLGFSIDDRHLKRAGLDYWSEVEVIHHANINEFLDQDKNKKLILFSKTAKQPYTAAPYSDNCYLLLGKETRGLPDFLLEDYSELTYAIPMWGKVRSLNLSTAAGIVVYEAYRQLAGSDFLKLLAAVQQ